MKASDLAEVQCHGADNGDDGEVDNGDVYGEDDVGELFWWM